MHLGKATSLHAKSQSQKSLGWKSTTNSKLASSELSHKLQIDSFPEVPIQMSYSINFLSNLMEGRKAITLRTLSKGRYNFSSSY